MKKGIRKAISTLLFSAVLFATASFAGLVGLELSEIGNFGKFTESAPEFFDDFAIVAEAATGGTYDNLKWTLDESTGELVVSGKGDMNFEAYADVPWTSYRESIKTVTIGNGITSIGKNAFRDCSRLTKVTIPNGVKRIEDNAFYQCFSLGNVTIPNGVTYIGVDAFFQCDRITSVTFPDSVTTIGRSAFSWCDRLATVNLSANLETISDSAFYSTAIKSITIPNGVTQIGTHAFGSCYSLTSATIPESVENIGQGAFGGCKKLASVIIPESVTKIEYGAFRDCTSLENIAIPSSVTDIESYAFSGCSSLTGITVDASNTAFSSDENGVLFNKDKTRLINYPVANTRTSYIIPDSVTEIASKAFSGCANLTDITIPYGATNIESYAFSGCTGITSIVIPDSVTAIGYDAFRNCSNLSAITLPDTLTSVGSNVLFGTMIYNDSSNWQNDIFYVDNILLEVKKSVSGTCSIKNGTTAIACSVFSEHSGLTKVIIPDSVKVIGMGAFYFCENLKTVTVGKGLTRIEEAAFYECENLTGLTLPDGVTYIGEDAFCRCRNLASINLPNNITEIASGVFTSCNSLTSINLPAGITSIGSWAFTHCSKLQNIIIPDKVTYIGEYAFCGCASFTSITIPDGITVIEKGTFDDCTNLTSIILPDSITSFGENVFQGCKSLATITIPDGITVIPHFAFAGCSGLTSIVIPAGVTQFVTSAFSGCSGMEYAYYLGTPKQWNSVFEGAYNEDVVDNIVFGYGTERLYYAGFFGNNFDWKLYTDGELIINGSGQMYAWTNEKDVPWYSRASLVKKVTIPDSITHLGYRTFYNCRNLTSITLPQNLTGIGEYTFYGCSKLENIIIPESVTKIEKDAFAFCSMLESINIPDGVTSIEPYTFYCCYKLADIKIPPNVTMIGDSAFASCEAIESITIPKSVTDIGLKSFYSCDKLVSIIVDPDNPAYLSDEYGVLYNKDKTKLIHYPSANTNTRYIIPDSVTKIDKYAFYYTALENITIPDSVTNVNDYAFSGCSRLANVFYFGTEEQWNSILIDNGNDYLLGANIHFGHVHKVNIAEEHVEPTCSESGYKVGVCLCGCRITEEIPSLGHDIIVDEAVDSTCKSTGLSEGQHCSRCDDATVEQTVTPVLGHTESDAVTENVVEAECGKNGCYDIVIYCLECGEELSRKTVSVDAIKHQYDKVTTKPTCTDKGYTTCTCLLCGDVYTENTVDALGHDIIIEEAVEPTCTSTGFTEGQYCVRCDDATVNQIVVPVKFHEHTGKNDSESHWKECVCGSVIEKQKHAYVDSNVCVCGFKRVVNATIAIKNNSGTKTINCGETLRLTANVSDQPSDAKICWFVDGVKSGEGEVFEISFESGTKIITVKLVDANGIIYQDANGKEISDSENIIVNSGFFQKIIALFMKLFGLTKIIPQAFKGIY